MADGGMYVDVSVRREPVEPTRVLRLRRPTPAMLEATSRALGVALPDKPNMVSAGAVRCLSIGPGEWMLVGALIDGAALEQAIAAAPAALTADLTEALVAWVVTGSHARDLLAKGCTLDLHPTIFGQDRCAQTALAQVFVTIERIPGADGFRIYADRSFAAHLELWFEDALIEFQHGNHR